MARGFILPEICWLIVVVILGMVSGAYLSALGILLLSLVIFLSPYRVRFWRSDLLPMPLPSPQDSFLFSMFGVGFLVRIVDFQYSFSEFAQWGTIFFR